jgi:hypothetical protein
MQQSMHPCKQNMQPSHIRQKQNLPINRHKPPAATAWETHNTEGPGPSATPKRHHQQCKPRQRINMWVSNMAAPALIVSNLASGSCLGLFTATMLQHSHWADSAGHTPKCTYDELIVAFEQAECLCQSGQVLPCRHHLCSTARHSLVAARAA